MIEEMINHYEKSGYCPNCKKLKALESIVKSVPYIYLLAGMIWSKVTTEELENIKEIYKEILKDDRT